MKNNILKWGMIGAGDVAEVKSGPAFRKVLNSDLIAVMRRDKAKVIDFAKRHQIPMWYTDADALVANGEIHAVYIATPPHVHLHYVERALAAGKMIYVEKPLALNAREAYQMRDLLQRYGGKLVVAHYRRANPYFLKIGELLRHNAIGKISLVDLHISKKALSAEELAVPKNRWRVDPAISGGGLFHDLAPHQIDLMLMLFGMPLRYNGLSNRKGADVPASRVSGQMLFEEDILFRGLWDFDAENSRDECEIIGTEGKIKFSFFEGAPIYLEKQGHVEEFRFAPLAHVQQPMIEQVVRYFRGEADNPCTIEDGIACMEIMDAFDKGEEIG